MPFDIPNDTTASVGPATYTAQGMPDEQDFRILAAGHAMTGYAGLGVNGLGLSTPSFSTVAAGSNGVDVSTFAGAGVLNLADATNSRYKNTGGTVYVPTSGGTAKITYTGISASTLTGCTTVSGTGTLSTGNAVTAIQVTVLVANNGAVQNVAFQPATDGTVTSFVASNIVQLTAPDTTNPRIDLIGFDNTGAVTLLTGTAATIPCMPAVTADANGNLTLAIMGAVYVPANATTVSQANIIDKRVPIRPTQAVTVVADAAYGATGSEGLVVYSSISTNRIVTLPASANTFNGYQITVADASGSCAGNSAATSKTIQIKPAGSDTVANIAAGTNWEEIREPYGSVTFQLRGTNWDIVAVSPAVRLEVFTTTSAVGTYRKSLAGKTARILMIGGGGAGGSGEKQPSGTAQAGGGGGQAGGFSEAWLNLSDLNATESVTVGAAGSAGGTRTSSGAGANGGNGGDTFFSIAGATSLVAQGGGGGGGGGVASGGAAGTAGTGNNSAMYPGVSGGAGAKGVATAAVAVAGTISTHPGAPSGGGGGGGATTVPGAEAAAAGGTTGGGWGSAGTGLAGGLATGGSGKAITTLGAAWFYGGSGGGGGTALTTAGNGTTGGTGGNYGGGGGGGGNGMGATGTNSNGNGGPGGAGVVVIWTSR